MMGHDDHDLERELQRNRPQPSDEFVESVGAHVGRSRGGAARRIATVGLLTTVLAAGLAALGGFGTATAAFTDTTKAVTKVVKPGKASTALAVVKKSPAQDQYKEKCNSGRGNEFEQVPSSGTYIPPSTGSSGADPTEDCDPGNSGSHNSGGD